MCKRHWGRFLSFEGSSKKVGSFFSSSPCFCYFYGFRLDEKRGEEEENLAADAEKDTNVAHLLLIFL